MPHVRSVNDYRENDPFWRRFLRLDDCVGSDSKSGMVEDPYIPEPPPKPCARRLTNEEWRIQENAAIERIDRRK